MKRICAFGKQFREVVGVNLFSFLLKYRPVNWSRAVSWQDSCAEEDIQASLTDAQIDQIKDDLILVRGVCTFNSHFIHGTLYSKFPFLLRVACAVSALAPNYNQQFSRNVTLYEHHLLKRLCGTIGLPLESVLLHNMKCYRNEHVAWVLLHDANNGRLLVFIQGIAQLHNAPLFLDTEPTELASGSTVHSGVYRAAYPIYETLSLYIGMYIEQNMLLNHTIVLCGHGFGGSVASLVGAMLLRHTSRAFTSSNTRVVAFGPFPFASQSFIHKEHIKIRTYVFRWDIVSRLSFHTASVKWTRLRFETDATVSCLSRDTLSESSNKSQLYLVPGDIYWLSPGVVSAVDADCTQETQSETVQLETKRTELKPCMCCKLAEPHDICELVFSEQAINDHFMYMNALESLVARLTA